jgi:transposase
MPTARTLATSLLPTDDGLRLDDVSIGPDQIIATLEATAPRSTCPVCGTWSETVHSLYQRTIADLPWGRQTVRLHLRVRKFLCRQPTCSRRVFTERLPRVVAPYARRTTRLTEVVRLLAFALGGEPGARIVERLGMATSPATLLRLIRRTAVTSAPTPRVLGVDDWAFRKGHRYGTILVDLEQHRVVEVLPARNAEPLVAWLQTHPGVEVVSRDRAPAYAEAARKGAPAAIQVADRWHVLQNLVEALERCLLRFRPALKVAAGLGDSLLGSLPSVPEAELVPWQQRAEAASQQKHASKVERYERMRALRDAGFTVLDIAEIVGATRPTVYRYLALGGPPERQRPPRSNRRVLAPYEPYLIRRWAEGCRNRSRLFREIRLQGYQYSARTVSLFLKRLEQGPSASAAAPSRPPVTRVPSARHVACLLVWRKDRLPEEERDYLRRLCDQEPMIALAYELAQEFADMARKRMGQGFEAWLARATTSDIPELDRFARGLTDDRPAIEAALSLEWSNGQTEGQVNKLKLLKRSMYGRANFDLLRLRLLHAA